MSGATTAEQRIAELETALRRLLNRSSVWLALAKHGKGNGHSEWWDDLPELNEYRAVLGEPLVDHPRMSGKRFARTA